MENFDYKLQQYYGTIFTEINDYINDYETLEIGIEIIKIAKERLNSDLNNKDILKEYEKLGEIIKQLEDIIKEYKNYCKDKNYCCDKSDFIYDYIKYYYDLGKISLSDVDKISDYLEEVLKQCKN